MNAGIQEQDLMALRFEDKGYFRIANNDPPLRRLELHLGTPSRPFDDLVNCLVLDSAESRLLGLGTEKGLVYVFDIIRNRMVASFKADHWIGSLVVSRRSVLVSNFVFRVREYSLRSGLLTYDIAASTKNREGFGPRGIIFTELKEGLLLFNSGYLSFKIYSIRLKKVLRTFSPFSTTKEPSNSRGTRVRNYDINKKHGVLTTILKDDPHLYLWHVPKFKNLGAIKLYNPEELPQGMSMVNNSIVHSDDDCFVLLQFNNPKSAKAKLISLLVVIRLSTAGDTVTGKVVLYDKLKNGHDLFLSQLVGPFKKFKKEIVGDSEDGYVLGIGMCNGYSLIFMVNLTEKKLVEWAYYKKFEEIEEVSAMANLKDESSITATSDGKIIIIKQQ